MDFKRPSMRSLLAWAGYMAVKDGMSRADFIGLALGFFDALHGAEDRSKMLEVIDPCDETSMLTSARGQFVLHNAKKVWDGMSERGRDILYQAADLGPLAFARLYAEALLEQADLPLTDAERDELERIAAAPKDGDSDYCSNIAKRYEKGQP